MKRLASYLGWIAICLSGLLATGPVAADERPLPIQDIERTEAVDFESEILTVFKANCLACHNRTKAKAGLVLETPATIREGGDSGPAVVPGQPEQSLLFQAAAHLDQDYVMPPEGNQSNAKNLTPEELGLLRLWIAEGAQGEVAGRVSLNWLPLNRRVQPTYAVAMTPSGRYAAWGFGNQSAVYDVLRGNPAGRLIDPDLPEAQAHRDTVNAIAFHPHGNLIATGGFREVKLWEADYAIESRALKLAEDDRINTVELSGDRLRLGVGYQSGRIQVRELSTGNVLVDRLLNRGPIDQLRFTERGDAVAVRFDDGTLQVGTISDTGWVTGRTPTVEGFFAATWRFGRLMVFFEDSRVECWGRKARDLWEKVEFQENTIWTMPLDVSYLLDYSIIADEQGTKRLYPRESDTPPDTLSSELLDLIKPAAKEDFKDSLFMPWNTRLGGNDRVATISSTRKHVVTNARGLNIDLSGARKAWRAIRELERISDLKSEASILAEEQLEALTSRQKKAEERQDKAVKELTAKQTAVEEAQKKFEAAQKAQTAAKDEVAQLENRYQEAERKLADTKAAAKRSAEMIRTWFEEANRSETGQIQALIERAEQALEQLIEAATASGRQELQLQTLAKETEQQKNEATEKVKAAAKSVLEENGKLESAQRELSLAENERDLAQQALEKSNTLRTDGERRLAEARRESSELYDEIQAMDPKYPTVPLLSCDYSPDGNRIMALENTGIINLWWSDTAEELESIQLDSGDWLTANFLTEDTILAIARDGQLRIVSVTPTWQLRRVLGSEGEFADRVLAVDFSLDGRLLAAGGGEPSRSGEVKVWELERMELIKDLPEIHSDVVFGLKFSPDAQFLASGGADRFARVVDLESETIVHSFEGHTHHVMDVSWQGNGRNLASAGGNGVVKIWDVTNGQRKRNIEGFKKEVTGVGFLGKTEELIASSGDARLAVYRSDGKQVLEMENADEFFFVESVSGNGKYVAAGGLEGKLRIWTVETGKPLTTVSAAAIY